MKIANENNVKKLGGEIYFDSVKETSLIEFPNGFWCSTIFDKHYNELSYKDSNGKWYKYTRDDESNILTREDGNGIIEYLTGDVQYGLYYKDNMYHAGCRHFAYEQAVDHWTERKNHYFCLVSIRAKKFLKAIEEHQASLKTQA